LYCQRLEKKTFNPAKNYFDVEEVLIKRPSTAMEKDLSNKIDKYSTCGFLTIFIGVILAIACAIIFGVLAETVHIAFGVAAFVGVLFFFIGGIVFARQYFWKLEHKYGEELCTYHKEHEEELWFEYEAEIKAYNEEQTKIAEAWRAEHVLEEKIRACLKDPMSSVEIADLARYYAVEYLKGDVSHETMG
jgi:hypothetical protein